MKLNLIMPMGGGGTRFGNYGFNLPKPLIEIYGKPFFYWATQSVLKYIKVESLTFVVLDSHVKQFNLDERIKSFYPDANIRKIPEVLPGAVLTCLEGCKEINNDYSVLFNDCDHLFICNEFYQFIKSEMNPNIDGGILTFKSKDPRFSFVDYDNKGYVNRTVEKQAISNDAICGAYYFKNKEIFKEATEIYLKKCSYSEFFVSGVYNIMAEQNLKIRSFRVEKHVSFGTPQEFEDAKNDNAYKNLL